MRSAWTEVGDRVLVRRYAFFDQNIVAVLSDDETLVVDTRTTRVQAREVLDDLRAIGAPPVGVVVNTHGHYDHVFGNRTFRPASIWGHERCAAMIRTTGDRQREGARTSMPELADELAAVEIDPPDRTFMDRATLCLGDREVELTYLGRGHTDNDIVVRVADADVLCAGDLLENGAAPFFGDGFPIEWPATVESMLPLVGDRTVVVPGHGAHAGRSFVTSSLVGLHALVAAARRVHTGELTLEDAVPLVPYSATEAVEPLRRAMAQLRGELDRQAPPHRA